MKLEKMREKYSFYERMATDILEALENNQDKSKELIIAFVQEVENDIQMFIENGVNKGITLEAWTDILENIAFAIEREDSVLINDCIMYGFLPLIKKL